MKSIVDSLGIISQPISNFDLRNQVLNGLESAFDPIHTLVIIWEEPIMFD